MKKEYIKPSLNIERFTLAQNIAESCGVYQTSGGVHGKPALADKSVCGWDIGGGKSIFVSASVCTGMQVDDAASIEGVCYNNPDGNHGIFSSN